MDLLTLRDRRTRLLISREYMLAANRLAKPPPWHSGGKRWAVSASTVSMAEREGRLVPGNRASCPPTFWSLQRSEPAKPGHRRARTAHGVSYAERIKFKPEPYRAEPCNTCDSVRQCLNNEFLKNFDVDQLRHVETATRNTLPTQKTISDEYTAIHGERSHSARNARWVTASKRVRAVHFYSAPGTSSAERANHGADGARGEAETAEKEIVQNIENEET